MKKLFSIRTIILAGSLLLQLSALCLHSRGAAGDVDLSFISSLSANVFEVAVAVQPDGKVLVGGQFTAVNGTNRNYIARLNANGSLDSSFNPGTGANARLRSVVVQSDGKVLIGGYFTTVNGTNRISLARLNANGTLDSGFNPDLPVGIFGSQYDAAGTTAVAVQPDGKVLVAGGVVHYYGCDYEGCASVTSVNFLVRLNADGSRDTNFNTFIPGPGAYQFVSSIGLQPDGKVLTAGSFTYASGTNSSYGIARLYANGSLDPSFNTVVFGVSSIALQPDGKLLIGGAFPTGIARLNANGSLDESFPANIGQVYDEEGNLSALSIALQPNGKVLVGGAFATVSGTNRHNIARLNADGSLDLSFNPGTGPNANVYSIALQPDGNVLMSGQFTTVNGVVRPYVARLYGDTATPSLNLARSNAFVIISWPVSGLNFQLQENANLLLPNSWTAVAQSAVTNAGQISVTVPTTVGREFFRLKSQ